MGLGRSKFILILIALAFIQISSVPFDLVLVAIATWAFFRPGREVLLEALIAGLLLDFLGKYTLGVNASLMVGATLLILVVKEGFLAMKTRPVEPNFWLAIPFLLLPLVFAIIVYPSLLNFFENGNFLIDFNSQRLIIDISFAVLIYPVLSFLSLRWQSDRPVQLDFRKKL